MLKRAHDIVSSATLSASARAVRRDKLTYLSVEKLRRLEGIAAEAVDRDVPGDILEFGVALGGSAILLSRLATSGRAFHGFDVFAMIPPPTSEKDDAKSRQRYEVISSGQSRGIDGADDYYGYRDNLFEEVKASFARHGKPVDGRAIHLHKGLFEESWPLVKIDAVAFAHVDCDWYDPVVYCLNALADLMSPGGAILIDDYNDYGGARMAVDEFLAARPDFMFEPAANPVLRKR